MWYTSNHASVNVYIQCSFSVLIISYHTPYHIAIDYRRVTIYIGLVNGLAIHTLIGIACDSFTYSHSTISFLNGYFLIKPLQKVKLRSHLDKHWAHINWILISRLKATKVVNWKFSKGIYLRTRSLSQKILPLHHSWKDKIRKTNSTMQIRCRKY